MESINCIFCKVPSTTIALEENGFSGMRCAHCDLIFISPRPDEAQVTNIYGHDQAQLSAHTHIESDTAKRLHARHTLSLIRMHKKEGRLLEIGSGAGYFVDEARKSGFDPHAIELNPKQAQFIKATFNIPCEQEPLNAQSFGGKKFDIIYHCDVISHFSYPIEEFTTMYNALSDDGVLIFETGNLADVSEHNLKKIRSFQFPDHLFFFGEKHLEDLLSMTGFTLARLHRYGITAQLSMINMVQTLRKNSKEETSSPSAPVQNVQQPILSKFFKKLYHRGMHITRYKIGRFIAKKDKPQTIIVIATKNRLSPS